MVEGPLINLESIHSSLQHLQVCRYGRKCVKFRHFQGLLTAYLSSGAILKLDAQLWRPAHIIDNTCTWASMQNCSISHHT